MTSSCIYFCQCKGTSCCIKSEATELTTWCLYGYGLTISFISRTEVLHWLYNGIVRYTHNVPSEDFNSITIILSIHIISIQHTPLQMTLVEPLVTLSWNNTWNKTVPPNIWEMTYVGTVWCAVSFPQGPNSVVIVPAYTVRVWQEASGYRITAFDSFQCNVVLFW